MSSIAAFIRLPKCEIAELRTAAVPVKRLFGAAKDGYCDFLRMHGQSVADYEWSGYILATLLVYLQQNQIDLMKSEFDELSTFLTNARGSTHFILTETHKRNYLSKLGGDFSEEALCSYYNEFNATAEMEMGKPMLGGIKAVRQSLNSVDESSIVILSIG